MIEIYSRLNDATKAHAVLLDAISGGYASFYSVKSACMALYEDGRFRSITDVIESLPQNLQEHPYLLLRKAEALRKDRQWDKAIAVAEAFVESGKGDDSQNHLALVIKAYALKGKGDLRASGDIFLSIVNDIPQDSQVCPCPVRPGFRMVGSWISAQS